MYQGHSANWTNAWYVGTGRAFASNHLTALDPRSLQAQHFCCGVTSPYELGGQNLK